MTVQTTSNLTNSLRTQYVANYLEAAYGWRLYDQLAIPVPGISMNDAIKGSTVQWEFLSSMAPGITAISQTGDLTPQILYDATASVTPTSRAEALQWAEQLEIQAFTNYAMERMKKLGENASESIDLLALDAATQGTWVERYAARASLDAGTAAHRASDSIFRTMYARLLALNVPGFVTSDGMANTWAAIMAPEPFNDISESGRIDSIGMYQDMGIHLNYELAKVGPFRLVVHPRAKAFYGAGADNATNVATTLNGATNPLALSLVTAGDVSANITAGKLWMVGTEETGSTNHPTNERFKVQSASTVTLTVTGMGENGGMRYAHVSGEAVRNADTVYTIVFGGPASLVKLYDPGTGEFGKVVGPKIDGLADQWASVAWKFYGGYGRITENRIVRGEYSASFDA